MHRMHACIACLAMAAERIRAGTMRVMNWTASWMMAWAMIRAVRAHDGVSAAAPPFVWTSPPVRIPSNMTTDAPLLGNGEFGVAHGGDLASGNLTFFFGANSFWSAPTGGISQCGFRDADMLFMNKLGAGGGVRQLGGLTLQVAGWRAAASGRYRAEQALDNATVYQTHSRDDGARMHLASHVSADEDTVLTTVQLENVPHGSADTLDLALVLWTRGGCHYGSSHCNRTSEFPPLVGGPPGSGQPSLIRDQSSFTACTFPTDAGSLPGGAFVARSSGLNFQHTRGFNVSTLALALRVVLANHSTPQLETSVITTNSQTGSDAVRLKLRLVRGPSGQFTPLTLVTAMRSSKDDERPKPTGFDTRATSRAAARVSHLSTTQTLLPVYESSYKWWRNHWQTSSVTFETTSVLGARLSAFYRGSSFLLAASSRSGKVAPGLYGPWTTTDHPMWGGDWHMDYNMQATFYAAASSNHPELSDSYVKGMLDFMPKARESARDEFNCPGLNFGAAIGPWGMYSAHVGDCGMRQDAVFAAINIASRWLWTRDRRFLTDSFGTKSTPYEFLKETVAFWECYLEADQQGVLHDYNDCVGELCDRTNEVDSDPLMTLALLRFAVNALLSASVAVGRDASLRTQWAGMLCTLAPFPTKEVNGTTVFVTNAVGSGSGGEDGQLEASMAIYPGGVVAGDNCSNGGGGGGGGAHALDYAAVANITRSTIAQMGLKFWQSYSFTKGFSAALLARVDKHTLYTALLNNLRTCTDPDNIDNDMNGVVCLQRNGLADNHNGGGLETIGGMDLCHNLVMQSRDGVIRLFPWLSTDFLRAGFRRLRALGGFIVSANYSAISGGVLAPVEVTFPNEDSRCQIEVPLGWTSLHVCDQSREVALAPASEGHVWGFVGRANATYMLQPFSCAHAL